MLRPFEPVTICLMDGRELRLSLSIGNIKNLFKRLGVKTLKELLDRDAIACVPILYEGYADRGDMTEDQFADLLPANPNEILIATAQLIGISMPERPTTTGEATTPTPEAVQ
jgi:hypothetical protein